jgi:hypothetical protein
MIKKELFTREQYWQDLRQPSINKQKAILTDEQREQYRSDYMHTYNRTEKAKETRQIYKSKEIECGCGSIVTQGHLASHEKSEKHFNWLKSTGQIPKDRIFICPEPKPDLYEVIVCNCGEKISKYGHATHLKSEKHKAKIQWIKDGKPEIIKSSTIYCETCDITISKSNIARHNNSPNHRKKLTKTEDKKPDVIPDDKKWCKYCKKLITKRNYWEHVKRLVHELNEERYNKSIQNKSKEIPKYFNNQLFPTTRADQIHQVHLERIVP